ncbi:YesL family protein [Evansella cellulosilytica]|uniref:DUF624 domain-containing protein n=1 Tax=Evansella cellulosilytica (strain ATCC 21833 / DSM 2522 / FERM P-1141 / JCM 9156 / N-4) TaxID=649639 RepID=E6TXK8_EVAC2|nr:YesL family protein [Evansella cellulosilytica]ADU28822.1 protein of unknown function DUF624 [Evansella cellulosilytica DSM 2522]
MNVSWMASPFYRSCDWIWKMAYVNLLWLGFTVLGFGILGFLPATLAMLTVMRKWLMGEPDIAIFKTFLNAYKEGFIRINLIGLLFAFGAYVIVFNYMYLGTIEGPVHTILSLGWYIGLIVYTVTLVFLIPTYVHYELKLMQYLKASFIVGLVNPLAMITLIIGLLLMYQLFTYIPGLIPFFGPSMLGMMVMWCAHMAFTRLERKKEKLENEKNDVSQSPSTNTKSAITHKKPRRRTRVIW